MSKPHDSYDPKDDRILVVSGGGVIRSFTAMGLRKLMATSDVRPLGKKHPWYKKNVRSCTWPASLLRTRTRTCGPGR